MSTVATETAKTWIRRGSVPVGRLLAGRRAVPTFLITGAQRSGTTSMFKALASHPAVLRPNFHKGVHYFDTNYHRGEEWYRAHFPLQSTVSRVARQHGAAHVFESSPYYLNHPLAAERFARDLPGVKVVVLLRDPVERAYSAHSHELARGFEDLGFEEAIAAEEERLAGTEEALRADPLLHSHSHQHHAYLSRGRYVVHLRRLAGILGRERIHVVDSHQLFREPEEHTAAVLRFLGLEPDPAMRFEKHNARSRSPLPSELHDRLRAHFDPWDEQLADWLGWQPSWRR